MSRRTIAGIAVFGVLNGAASGLWLHWWGLLTGALIGLPAGLLLGVWDLHDTNRRRLEQVEAEVDAMFGRWEP